MNNESIAATTLAALIYHQSTTNPAATQALDRELLVINDKKAKMTAPPAQVPFKGKNTSIHKAAYKNKQMKKLDAPVFPVEPRIIQTIKKPRTFVNHSYQDFSSVPPVGDEKMPSDIEQMNFPQKVHHILSRQEYAKYISWQPHGRAFRINIPKMFENTVCSTYFGHTRYSSFLRQLSNHSFKNITQGPDRNCYYHECMLRGLPHLTKYMPKPKDARRLIADPVNEPDFYAVSVEYPVPDMNGSRSSGNVILPEAEISRLKNIFTPQGATMPPAKRARVSTSTTFSTSSPISSVAGRNVSEMMRVKPGTPRSDTSNTVRDVSGINADSLLTATYSMLSATQGAVATAPFPDIARSPFMSSMGSPNVVKQQVVPNTQAATPCAPLLQTAVDRNEAVLSALVAMATQAANQGTQSLPGPPRPVPLPASNDEVLSSALAFLLQNINTSQQQQQQQVASLQSMLNGRF